MKKLFALLFFVISANCINAQELTRNLSEQYRAKIDSLLKIVDIGKQDVPTGVLYDRTISFAALQSFKQHKSVNRSLFYQATMELRNASYDTLQLLSTQKIREISDDYEYRLEQIPIGIQFSRFNYIDTLALRNGYVKVAKDGQISFTKELKKRGLKEGQVFMGALLADKNEYSKTISFVMPSELMQGNMIDSIKQIEIDFGDGVGFRRVSRDDIITVNYNEPGEKKIIIRVTTNEDTIEDSILDGLIIGGSTVFGKYGEIPLNLRKVRVDAEISFLGPNGNFKGIGRVTYLLKNPTQGLKKPVLIVDGFDPKSKNSDIDIFNNYLNTSSFPFANSLYDADYDIVILDFAKEYNSDANTVINGGADFIQRNAYVAVKVIEDLNLQLQSNNSENSLVVIGPSMGGLTTRYALAYMEQHGKTHNTRLWVSFDSPHKGANIPIGVQQFANYFESISSEAGEALDQLNSPAARQMLIHHYKSNSQNPIGDPNHNPYWINSLEAIGFPQQSRNVAISNGSLNGTNTGTPSARAVTLDIKSFGITVGWGYINTTGNYGSNQLIFKGILPLSTSTTSKYAYSMPNSYSLDNSPGGTRPTFKDMRSSGDWYYIPHWSIPIESHSFIPTKSSLAFTGINPDLKENISSRNLVAMGEVPFDSYWGPLNKNMAHISFDSDLMPWILNEINGISMPPTIDYQISGPSIVCNSCVGFSINALPTGVSVQWSCSANLNHNACNQERERISVKASSINTSGPGWVEARINNQYGTLKIVRKDLWVGTPSAPTSITFSPSNPYVGGQLVSAFVTANNPPQATAIYQWDVGNHIIRHEAVDGSMIIFKTLNTQYSYYTYFEVSASNSCGNSPLYAEFLEVMEQPGGGGGIFPERNSPVEQLTISPNPTSNYIEVVESNPSNDNQPWEIRLLSAQGLVVYSTSTMLPKTISVNRLQHGVYILHAKKGSHIEQHRIIVK